MARVIIPKRHLTFTRCLKALLNTTGRRAFQSELKRVVYSNKSWREVVKREIELWNGLISAEYPGLSLLVRQPRRNPRTGRSNEILYAIHPRIEVEDKPDYFLVWISGGGHE